MKETFYKEKRGKLMTAEMMAFLFAFYGDMCEEHIKRIENTTDQLQMELLRNGDVFYVNSEKHYAKGDSQYDVNTRQSYVIDENGKRWNDNDFVFSNVIEYY